MNKAENDDYLEKALSGIPEHFSGKLLEVPVGTGILTIPVYQTMPEADITCPRLLGGYDGAGAGKSEPTESEQHNLSAGRCGCASYADGSFGIVLSLNGFHAFPDKEAAYREIFRVLRPGGTFCGCFYVKGEHKRTDWFVRHVYEKGGILHAALWRRFQSESTAGWNVYGCGTWET